MDRPTLSLAVIAKDEKENVKRLFDSCEGVFDEIVFVDTGSTDGTQDIAQSLGASVYHFKWINDFSAARNFALDQVKTDYVMWVDLDDVLTNKEALIDFRNNALKYFDYVLANYHYAIDRTTGKPIISFTRERIFRTSCKPRFNYRIHEGCPPWPGARAHHCTNWSVTHLRTDEDHAKDKSRNLLICQEEKAKGNLDGRLTFYYGKELFENGKTAEAVPVLMESIERMDIAPHDRVLAIQYGCYATLAEIEKFKPEFQGEGMTRVINLAMKGILLEPRRAEFWTIIADCYLKLGKFLEALPYYSAAANCTGVAMAGDPFTAPIQTFAPLYRDYPRNKMASIYATAGDMVEARRLLDESIAKYDSGEGKLMLEELNKIQALTNLTSPKIKTEDIVFTCPPQTAYEFDEAIYKTKGMGGSETALIEMAKWVKKLTGRPVKVFNMRNAPLISESGVEYISTNHLHEYMAKYEPKVHIAWRHNLKVTNAPSYLWCHDLMIPGVELGLNHDKVLSLSPFHRDFLASSQGVPRDRILLTRNGISPEKWDGFPKVAKNPHKFVYASSPDRGLDRCMLILDLVRARGYDVQLHVYYGLENLYKFGLADLGDKLKKMMSDRPWVTYHGFTEQKQMYQECQDAAVWCHPNDFIETFQITGLEMLMNGVYPITRRWGAVRDTLAFAEKANMARLLDVDSITPEQHKIWADECIRAIETKAWENIAINPDGFSWETVAGEWCKMFDLWPSPPKESELEDFTRMPTRRAPEIGL